MYRFCDYRDSKLIIPMVKVQWNCLDSEPSYLATYLASWWIHPLTLIVCVLDWKCPVIRAKGVFLLPLVCVHLSPPLVTLPPIHFMQVHPDVSSCVVEGCPLVNNNVTCAC